MSSDNTSIIKVLSENLSTSIFSWEFLALLVATVLGFSAILSFYYSKNKSVAAVMKKLQNFIISICVIGLCESLWILVAWFLMAGFGLTWVGNNASRLSTVFGIFAIVSIIGAIILGNILRKYLPDKELSKVEEDELSIAIKQLNLTMVTIQQQMQNPELTTTLNDLNTTLLSIQKEQNTREVIHDTGKRRSHNQPKPNL